MADKTTPSRKSSRRPGSAGNVSRHLFEGTPNPSDPEVARKECLKWYNTIYPPSRHAGQGSVDGWSWSGEYDE